MKFIATIGNIKTFKDGGLKLELEIPQIYQKAVLTDYDGFREKNVDVTIVLSEELDKIKNLRKSCHFLMKQYAVKTNVDYQSLHDKILASDKLFGDKEYTSLTELTLDQLLELEKTLVGLLNS